MESQWRRKWGSAYQWGPASPEVAEALENLYRRVQRELEDYRAFAQERGEMARVARADDSLSWVATRGRETVEMLCRLATVASPAVRRHLVEAARALVSLADIARERDMSSWSNREILLDWAEQALSTLEVSIEHSGESEEVDPENWSQDETEVETLLTPETGRSRYVAVVEGCAPQAHEPVAA